MKTLLNIIWVLLLALSAGSYLVGENYVGGSTAAWLLMGAALIKLILISSVYMELKYCRPLYLRVAMGLYALTLGLIAWVSSGI
ncbi:MAG: hypothetical protein HOM34_04970 [Planctomycetes bacterium]|jgi:cytochrome c oxidase subunit IV|nr:hypothetical protein [Planctomycetota bacterium]MBT4559340.1 hypothetical protein [Planctomycetota bacterium]MBT5102168.1 hypothetical protein [Planctomycetota bacterium]MBT5120057.1 hypothetical protein [Planctomycetota bacterium]